MQKNPGILGFLLADPTRFERVTFAFGAQKAGFSGTIRYYDIAL